MKALAFYIASLLAAGTAAGIASQAFASGWCDTENRTVCGTDPGPDWPDLPPPGGDHQPVPPGENTPPGNTDGGGSGDAPPISDQERREQCDRLDRGRNEATCPSRITQLTPVGYYLTEAQYGYGSALWLAREFNFKAPQGPTENRIREQLGFLVAHLGAPHHDFRELTYSYQQRIRGLCDQLGHWDWMTLPSVGPFPTLQTSQQVCGSLTVAMAREADRGDGFVAEAIGYVRNRYGLDLTDIIPATVIALWAPENSMHKTFVERSAERKCYNYWREHDLYRCGDL